MSCWILIEAMRPDRFGHAVIGPFDDPAQALRHLQDSGQVDGICEDDAVDAWTGDDTDKAATTAAWDSAAEPWWLYAPVPDGAGPGR